MAKCEFARASLTYNSTEYGVFNLSLESVYSEIDVTDTKSTLGESEFIGNKQEHSITFDTYKDATASDITLNETSGNTAVFTVVSATAGDDTTYTGALVLLNKTVGGNTDGAVTVNYSGKFSGALTEAQPA